MVIVAGGAIRGSGKAVHPAGQRRKARRRTTSGSKPAHSPTSVSVSYQHHTIWYRSYIFL